MVNGGEDNIDFMVYDVLKAFDKLGLDLTTNDLYETIGDEARDDKIALLHEANKRNMVAVNTPVGISERV